jgi:hypothetical protein
MPAMTHRRVFADPVMLIAFSLMPGEIVEKRFSYAHYVGVALEYPYSKEETKAKFMGIMTYSIDPARNVFAVHGLEEAGVAHCEGCLRRTNVNPIRSEIGAQSLGEMRGGRWWR